MRVFVTGAGGFIGSHLTERLVSAGHEVKALVYYNAMNSREWLDYINPEIRDKIDIVAGDIRDLSFVKRAMEGCQGVFHLAALIGIPYSYVNPESYIDTNIKGTMNVLEAARELGVEKIIHTSTSEVYGTALKLPIDENHPLQGQSPYSASKIAADQMAYAYACSFQLPVITVRPFNTFGPRQSVRAVIPTIITQMLSGKDNLKLGATSPTRDFSYVDDTVSGFLAAFDSKDPALYGQVLNLGSCFEISVRQVAELIAAHFGRPLEISTDQIRLRPEKSEVERLWADNAKAKSRLGWQPVYEGLEGFKKALKKTIAWYSESENLRKFAADRYVV